MHEPYAVDAFFYYGSYAVVGVFVLLILHRRTRRRVFWWSMLVLALVFTWARFIEPQLIVVRETTIHAGFTADVALIADLHVGLYDHDGRLARVVGTINQHKLDVVLIAGDFTYRVAPADVSALLAPLAHLTAPTYAVLGNHDSDQAPPGVRLATTQALTADGVHLIDNTIVPLPSFTLVGLGSHRAGEDDVSLLSTLSPRDHVVVLTHNPDTTLLYATDTADVTLVGHTHCGQVRIPYLYQYVIPTVGHFFDGGLVRTPRTQLYITCGLGEVGLPLRLFDPPAIDIIHFR